MVAVNWPQWIRKLSVRLVGDECTSELLDQFNIKNIPCVKLAASKTLSLGIICGAMIVKVPQILKVLLSRSAEGLSFLSVVMETLAASIAFAYNFRADNPFTTYGETLFMTLQNIILLLLMGLYRGQTMRLILLFSLYSVMMSSLLIPSYVTFGTLRSMQAMTIPLSMASRLPQIWTIWRHHSTGQLSSVSTFLIWAGSVARVYTCIQETPNDRLLLLGFLLAAVLNSVIMGQIIYYGQAKKRAIKPPKRGIREDGKKRDQEKGKTRKSVTPHTSHRPHHHHSHESKAKPESKSAKVEANLPPTPKKEKPKNA